MHENGIRNGFLLCFQTWPLDFKARVCMCAQNFAGKYGPYSARIDMLPYTIADLHTISNDLILVKIEPCLKVWIWTTLGPSKSSNFMDLMVMLCLNISGGVIQSDL